MRFSSLQPSQHFILWLFFATTAFAFAVQPGKSWRYPLGEGASFDFPRDALRIGAIAVVTALACVALARTIAAVGL